MIRLPLAAFLLVVGVLWGSGFVAAGPQFDERNSALLQGLDKITARVSALPIAVGETISFFGLRITLRACRQSAPIESPEAAAYLEIVEISPGEQAEQVFSGWMFASSPALSGLEHPIYDVWVIACGSK
ncbi:DUF2155 domain-containing protein [Azospirillaceae bacterium]